MAAEAVWTGAGVGAGRGWLGGREGEAGEWKRIDHRDHIRNLQHIGSRFTKPFYLWSHSLPSPTRCQANNYLNLRRSVTGRLHLLEDDDYQRPGPAGLTKAENAGTSAFLGKLVRLGPFR